MSRRLWDARPAHVTGEVRRLETNRRKIKSEGGGPASCYLCPVCSLLPLPCLLPVNSALFAPCYLCPVCLLLPLPCLLPVTCALFASYILCPVCLLLPLPCLKPVTSALFASCHLCPICLLSPLPCLVTTLSEDTSSTAGQIFSKFRNHTLVTNCNVVAYLIFCAIKTTK
jgi:hypothetical protein